LLPVNTAHAINDLRRWIAGQKNHLRRLFNMVTQVQQIFYVFRFDVFSRFDLDEQQRLAGPSNDKINFLVVVGSEKIQVKLISAIFDQPFAFQNHKMFKSISPSIRTGVHGEGQLARKRADNARIKEIKLRGHTDFLADGSMKCIDKKTDEGVLLDFIIFPDRLLIDPHIAGD